MDDERYSTLNEKIDAMTEEFKLLKSSIDELIDIMDQRKDVIKKGADAMNNIHKIFGGQGINISTICGVVVGDDTIPSDPTQTPILAVEDTNYNDNPFD